jgi:hypothetical protein
LALDHFQVAGDSTTVVPGSPREADAAEPIGRAQVLLQRLLQLKDCAIFSRPILEFWCAAPSPDAMHSEVSSPAHYSFSRVE